MTAMDRKKIAIISTGGTIEKTYDELEGVMQNQVSNLDVMLAQLQLEGIEVVRIPLMNKDSLEMTAADHDLIARTAGTMAEAYDGVVVVHGTDRLAVTGERCVELLDEFAAPVVLTGAMRPYALKNTDALQNLVEALLAVQICPPGVYVAMHNTVLQFPGVVKDRDHGRFVKIAALVLALLVSLAVGAPPAQADIAPRPDGGKQAGEPASEKLKVKVEMRAVVHHDEVVVCKVGDAVHGGADCPVGRASAVGVIPAEAGPLRLPVALGTVRAMSEAHPDDPCGENHVVEGAPWEQRELGRTLTALSPTSGTYQKLIGEVVGIPGVLLTGLYRLDLEGDGTDEVVFTADSHGGERPFTEEPYATYSFIGVRKVTASGEVVTHLLYESRATVHWEGGFPDISRADLDGFTDLDGDGTLEIVVTARGYESYTTFVHHVGGAAVETLGCSGCAI